MQRKKIIITASVICLLILSLWLIVKFTGKTKNTVQIETTTVSKGNISNLVTATGTIEPIKQVEVGTQVSGVVQNIYVDYNSEVKSGQLIAELEKTNLLASVNEAMANYNTALYEMNYLQKIFDRQEALFQKKVISETDYDEAQYKLITAKGTVEKRKTDLEKAKTNLSYASIYSPIDGVILSKSVDVGQTVAASFSTPTLFTIAQNLKEMQVEADVDEADIGQVKEGQRVVFNVDAFQGEEFQGVVTQVRLNPTITSSVVTYTVVIKADNPNFKLMPGLTAMISVYTMEVNNVLVLPQKALSFKPAPEIMIQYYQQNGIERPQPPKFDGEKPPMEKAGIDIRPNPEDNNDSKSTLVWVKKGSSIRPQPVKLGETDGIHTQIVEGLNEGDSVVLKMESAQPLKAQTAANGNTNNGSPFMPKPPGQRNKK
ncbi:MAG TPA: efflux RND transporter periplasmic adaptor subunit [Marinilabiliales bacterium]|jgi:HlyD family secretion protein|nr:MAG: efflux transporter periplasmic adaptor subunit [Bacteroidetes bacterium GWA2_40_14]OFX57119.1 MAG: efflux transporter periplasmic adaptor subunit [Bacteroidetes bacterium GWC2_40_13]OFX73163.1 MAG: efflux transporter periplasmic adaptor subunit [Bacteroidetes bacterium GWD2_40_43]OFX91718.1 MAG: efflux transporter periplasmic adaptor subunit [Bacteroidetes bacterium GWE2_40_63]OFY24528.1 MAG: efflux transporter periplasmic adaptor subunit [Bacteroidetes bacterium GWF2_40_13]OFZ23833.1 